jgi:hypothetical protein
VQRLIDLAHARDMKLLIGGGWFNWHHEKAIRKDVKAGIKYYLQYIDAFHDFAGFYIEPTGEGSETKRWDEESAALLRLIEATLARRPEFEFALAIGKFNNEQYLRRMARLDPNRVFWWWCWGDPLGQHALDLYPSVLRWHTTIQMSAFHGSTSAPSESEDRLAGFATSYDPGQGYGNPWNGWAKMGTDKPRDVHPNTVPYFAHQYWFRERCWNPSLTQPEFVARLHRRLFDHDAPGDAGQLYWTLSQLTSRFNGKQPVRREELRPIGRFLEQMRGKAVSPCMSDTLARMQEAIDHLLPESQD